MKKAAKAILIGLLLSGIGLTINSTIARSATNVNCKSASDTHNFGSFYPGDQYVTDHTYWCWGINSNNVRVITYRTDSVTAAGDQVGGLCDPGPPQNYLVGSGTNYREWTDEVVFKCATNIVGVFVTRDDKMTIWVDAEGQYCGPDNCPCAAKGTCGK
jgi:hypothetical protein